MRTATFVAMLILAINVGAIFGEDASSTTLRAKPIQIVSCDVLPPEAVHLGGFMQHKPGFQIFYLIEGADLIGIKSESLSIDSVLTADGKDISKKRNGNPSYQQGSFPKASEDGKYCVFSLEVDDASQFGKVEKIAVNGSIVALIGSNRQEKTVELKVGDKKETKIGPYSIQVSKSNGGMFGGMMPMLTPGSSGDSAKSGEKSFIGIKLTGPMSGIIKAKFKDGDHELQSGYSYDSKSRNYDFPTPKSGKITLTLSYWADLKEAKVKIGQ
jgi:hypothetical protein